MSIFNIGRHELWCKKCDKWVSYTSMTGHANCDECKELLGFFLHDGIITLFSWSPAEDNPGIPEGHSVRVPIKQRWIVRTQ